MNIFSSGPFRVTPNRARAVDFTTPVLTGYYKAVIPLQHKSKMWYFTDPFTIAVWIVIFLCIPIYTITMGVADHVYNGPVDWVHLCGFVLRNTLSEQSSMPTNTLAYQKVLVITWLFSTLVLVQAYAGSLTAMLSKPIFHDLIKSVPELLNQDKVALVIEKGTMAEHFTRSAETGSAMRRYFEKATIMPQMSHQERIKYGCYTNKIGKDKKIFGSLCHMDDIYTLLSQDYSNTGKCNFYLIKDNLFTTKSSHFAVQVERA